MPSFPTFTKQWQRPVTTHLPLQTVLTTTQALAMIAVKDALLAPATLPLILRGCADGVTFSTSTDLVTTASDVVAATSGNHTWLWFEQPATGLEFVVDFNQADVYSISMAVSVAAGFTGGSASARPTATDESTRTGITWFCSGFNERFEVIVNHSVDGRTTYVWILCKGAITSAWIIGEAKPSHSSWDGLVFALQGSGSTGTETNLNYWTSFITGEIVQAYAASGTMLLRCTEPYASFTGTSVREAFQARPSLSGKLQFWPIGLACDNSPRIGRHGRFHDLYYVPWMTPPGWIERDPGGGEQAFMTVGHGIAIPWPSDMAPVFFNVPPSA